MNPYSISLELCDPTIGDMKVDYTSLHYFLTFGSFAAMLSTSDPCHALQYSSLVSLSNDALDRYADAVANSDGSGQILLLDARNAVYGPNRIIESCFTKLLMKYQHIFLVACQDTLNKLQESINGSRLIIPALFRNVLVVSRSGNIASSELVGCMEYSKIDDMVKRALLGPALKSSTGNDRIPITSSNIYANLYFDARQLFQRSAIWGHVVDWLCLTIEKHNLVIEQRNTMKKQGLIIEPENAVPQVPDALVCSSANGSCLAGGISAWLNIPIVYLKNIGPSMNTRDEAIAAKIKKGYRYIYVFDFMCMGSELQRVKTLCAIRKAKLEYSIGLSMYRAPMARDGTREKDPEDIIVIEKIDALARYECYPDED